MACSAEAHSHGDDHSHGGHDHDHEDDLSVSEFAAGRSLLPYIDTERVWCLNELTPNCCRTIFRPLDKRMLTGAAHELRSDEEDPDLLLHIPFNALIRFTGFSIIGGPSNGPKHVKIWADRDDLDFGTAGEVPPAQELELVHDGEGRVVYNVKRQRFSSIGHLTLFFDRCFDDDQCQVNWISLFGEFTSQKRRAVEAVYESQPLPKKNDPVKDQNQSQWGLGQ